MGEGLGLEPEMFEMNRMREGEIPGVIDVLANAIHANFEVNLDWIHFSPPQLLTLEPRLSFSSLVSLHPFFCSQMQSSTQQPE